MRIVRIYVSSGHLGIQLKRSVLVSGSEEQDYKHIWRSQRRSFSQHGRSAKHFPARPVEK